MKRFFCFDCNNKVKICHLVNLKTNKSKQLCEDCHSENVKVYSDCPEKFSKEEIKAFEDDIKRRSL